MMEIARRGTIRYAVREYIEHYDLERAHQGLGNDRIESITQMGNGAVMCNERLGGLLKHYHRAVYRRAIVEAA